MPSPDQALSKLKVPELKARCKELKIPNFSKLSKTDLIARILAVTSNQTGHEATHADDTALTRDAATPPILTSSNAESQKKQKERKGSDPKHKAATTGTPGSSKASSSKRARTGREETAKGNRGDKAVESAPIAGKDPNTTTVSASTLAHPLPTLPSIGGTAPRKGLSTIVRPGFKPLTVVGSRTPVSKPTNTVASTQAVDLTSPANRTTHVESHFLSDLLTQLNRHRIKPIVNPPYPSPAGIPTSPAAHLAFQGLHPKLYTDVSPEEFEVALHFWIARLHSYMQLGSGEAWSGQAKGMGVLSPDLSTWPPIMGCQQVAGGVYVITTSEESRQVKYLIIGGIGEVIGHSRDVGADEEGLVKGCRIRGDWAAYIADAGRSDLLSLVKSKDTYGFPGGISKAWRVGQAAHLVKIAEKAVLAACALNSFSGEKMSSIAMDAAWLGRPVNDSQAATPGKVIDIYLPEMSQVLSVHLPPDLHPALAIVHRVSGYSEYVLAETGQVVGTENEGVAELWQGLLGCSEKGSREAERSSSFWTGWELRLRGEEA